jgi:lysozyme
MTVDTTIASSIITKPIIPAGMTLGIDESSWQDNSSTPFMPDWAMAKAAGAEFAYVRLMYPSPDGKPAIDRQWTYNWHHAKDNMLVGAYVVFLWWAAGPNLQIDTMKSIFKNGYTGDLPIAIDFEHIAKYGDIPARNKWLPNLEKYIEFLEGLTKKPVVLYTNPDIIRTHLSPVYSSSILSRCKLWVADYRGNPEPEIYRQWSQWSIYQFTDRLDGKKFGCESLQVDGNLFHGTKDDLYRFAGLIPPIPVITIEDRVKKLEDWAVSMGYKN